MICPQTKAECKNLAFCDMTGKCLEHEADLLTPPPPPPLAEIERLAGDLSLALSALMAAIRAYGRE